MLVGWFGPVQRMLKSTDVFFMLGDSLGNGVSWTDHWSCADHNSMRL